MLSTQTGCCIRYRGTLVDALCYFMVQLRLFHIREMDAGINTSIIQRVLLRTYLMTYGQPILQGIL